MSDVQEHEKPAAAPDADQAGAEAPATESGELATAPVADDATAVVAEASAAEVDAEATTEVEAAAEAEVPAVVLQAGGALRAAREQAGLSVAEVAQSLKFSVRQIETLESDDYASLPGNTFVRGFVRGYAKLLKLDPEELLSLLDTRTPVVLPDVRPPQNMGEAATTMAGARRSSSPALIGAALLATAAALLGAWHFVSGKPSTTTVTRPSPSQESAPAPAAADVPALKPPQMQVESTPVAPTAAQPVLPPPDGRQLVFVFSERSWLEVKDASQRVVATGVFPAGERQTASGKPPFQVWVGKASGVKVYDGEREIDLKPHTRDEVARLTVE